MKQAMGGNRSSSHNYSQASTRLLCRLALETAKETKERGEPIVEKQIIARLVDRFNSEHSEELQRNFDSLLVRFRKIKRVFTKAVAKVGDGPIEQVIAEAQNAGSLPGECVQLLQEYVSTVKDGRTSKQARDGDNDDEETPSPTKRRRIQRPPQRPGEAPELVVVSAEPASGLAVEEDESLPGSSNRKEPSVPVAVPAGTKISVASPAKANDKFVMVPASKMERALESVRQELNVLRSELKQGQIAQNELLKALGADIINELRGCRAALDKSTQV